MTVLRSPGGKSGKARAAKIVDYLHGRPPNGDLTRSGPAQSASPDLDSRDSGLYYADTAENVGTWLGSGFAKTARNGEVDAADLVELLSGRDGQAGELLANAAGGPGRQRAAPVKVPFSGLEDSAILSLAAGARRMDVYKNTLGQAIVAANRAEMFGDDLPASHLKATRTGPRGGYEIGVGELRRFASARKAPAVVMGYDLTFSCPKSVSLLWAMGDDRIRSQVTAAVERAVGQGVAYLEQHACVVKVGGELVFGDGLLAAGFLHGTSRALDPQLHWHCAVLNASAGPEGEPRAIVGSHLFAHARTAGYLSGAQLRHALSSRLGVKWDTPKKGLADIIGIDRGTIDAFSKRSERINTVLEESALSSENARRGVVFSTRDPKAPILAAELVADWNNELVRRGYTPRHVEKVILGQRSITPQMNGEEISAMCGQLLSSFGTAKDSPVFDRRGVIEGVSTIANDRLGAERIEDITDALLCHAEVVPLASTRQTGPALPGALMHLSNGRVIPTAPGLLYSTRSRVELEAAKGSVLRPAQNIHDLAIGSRACLAPDARAAGLVGERPPLGARRGRWDAAVAALAVHDSRHCGPESTLEARALWAKAQKLIERATNDRAPNSDRRPHPREQHRTRRPVVRVRTPAPDRPEVSRSLGR